MNQLTTDYLDGIELLGASLRLGRSAIRRLVLQVTLIPDESANHIWLARPKYKYHDDPELRAVKWSINPHAAVLNSPYRVERIEAMQSLAVYSLAHLLGWSAVEFANVCDRAGVAATMYPEPRKRWIIIVRRRPDHTDYPLQAIEDRPFCKICKTRRVASGSAIVDQHDNCHEFFHGVLMPALMRQLTGGKNV